MRLTHYENFAMRCGGCGHATMPLDSQTKAALIDEMVNRLTPDQVRSLCSDALKRLWTEPGTGHKPDRSLIAENARRLLGHM